MRHLTIVFDLDGTIVDTAPDLCAATNHVLSTRGLEACDPALLTPFISFGARRMITEAAKAAGTELSEEETDRALEEFLTYYAANIAVESRPYPGAEIFLNRLTEVGSRVALCTNKTEALSRKLLGQLGLLGAFHAIAGRDTLPVHKPDPAHIIGSVILADGNPNRAIMIGDSENDILAAKTAGIPVIGVSFGYSSAPIASYEPDVVIDGFGQLEDAIIGLSGRL